MAEEKMTVQNEVEEMSAEKMSELLKIRRDKLTALRAEGRVRVPSCSPVR